MNRDDDVETMKHIVYCGAMKSLIEETKNAAMNLKSYNDIGRRMVDST